MLSEFSFLSTTLFTSSLVVAAAGVGIYVLPWSRRQLEVSAAAWAYAGELIGAFGRRFAGDGVLLVRNLSILLCPMNEV